MHRASIRLIAIAVILVVSLALARPAAGWPPTPDALVDGEAIRDKIAINVWESLDGNPQADLLVILSRQADLSLAPSQPTREAQVRYVYEALRRVADQTQAPLLKLLRSRGVEHQSFFLVNAIRVRGDRALVLELAARPDVARILANRQFLALEPLPRPEPDDAYARSILGIEWNVARIGAPDVWNTYGVRGEGIVVAGNDTGVDWDHPALIHQYRGWNGSGASHDYHWHDAWDSTAEPWDDHGHGTHTMGTAVGDDGAGEQIGVAPGARWIACRNMNHGVGTPASYVDCFQFFLAPTDLNGDNPEPGKAPHVINNSWACVPSEGCDPTDPTWEDVIHPAVQTLRAAGIFVVVSAGNEGPSCGSVKDPPAIYPESFSVGASNSNDAIASFSSRGPVTVDGSNRFKPDVVAPGVGIRSSLPEGGYASWGGTSMAAPHVAGEVALMWSAVPRLAGDVDFTEQIIEVTARPKVDTTCGAAPDGRPNNVWGWGIVDALAAVKAARCAVEGDLNLNGMIDLGDAQVQIAGWGSRAGDGVYRRIWDMDADGDVDVVDIERVISRWGESCES